APAAAPLTGQSIPDQVESQVTTTETTPAQQQAPAAPPAPQTAPSQAPQDTPPAPAAAPSTPAPPADLAPAAPAATSTLESDSATRYLENGDAVTLHGPGANILVLPDKTVNGYGFRFSSNGDSYAVVSGPGNRLTFSGDWTGDLGAQIEKARRMTNGPFLWFTHQGKSYIVTDPALIAQIEEMYKPMQKRGMGTG